MKFGGNGVVWLLGLHVLLECLEVDAGWAVKAVDLIVNEKHTCLI